MSTLLGTTYVYNNINKNEFFVFFSYRAFDSINNIILLKRIPNVTENLKICKKLLFVLCSEYIHIIIFI